MGTILRKTQAYYESFADSDVFIILIMAVGTLGFVFQRELEAILVIGAVSVVNLLLVRNILPVFHALGVIGLIPLQRYGEVEYFVPLYKIFEPFLGESVQEIIASVEVGTFMYAASVFVVFGIILAPLVRWFTLPARVRIGRFFYPTTFVALAVTLGGLGHLGLAEYFSGPALYYVFFLGIGMIIIYFYIEAYLPTTKQAVLQLAKMLSALGLMAIFMALHMAFVHYEALMEDGLQRLFQFRNILSNSVLITMPFAFYLALRTQRTFLFILLGVLQYLVLLFSFSRGGIVFGTLAFALLVPATIWLARGKRLLVTLSFVVLFGGIYLSVDRFLIPAGEAVEAIQERVVYDEDESRVQMFYLALERFQERPLFGTGIAEEVEPYSPQPMAMEWYHSTVSEVLGSLGLLGVAAYLYQEGVRLFTFFEKPNRFNVYGFLALVGFGGYSLVNVGYFAPLPSVATLLYLFVITERHNRLIETDATTREAERLPLPFSNDKPEQE